MCTKITWTQNRNRSGEKPLKFKIALKTMGTVVHKYVWYSGKVLDV
jgi:hypothetical protein